MVEQPRQHLPGLGHLKIHAPQAVENAPVCARQNEIGIAPHQLQDQLLTAGHAHLVRAVKAEAQDAFGGGLREFRDASAGEVLAQEHTEHRRLRGIVKARLRQMNARTVDIRREQELFPPAELQQHGVAGGLLNFINARAEQDRLQLLYDGSQKVSVKGHSLPPWQR